MTTKTKRQRTTADRVIDRDGRIIDRNGVAYYGVTNTAREAMEQPLKTAFEAATFGIERQEAQGQKELVQSEVIPSSMDDSTRAALTAAGVVFGKQAPGDPLFVSVTLPEGWKKVATNHSMWSNLVDDRGRVRAAMFYKAAFYDRDARITARSRFNHRTDYDAGTETVTDGDAVIFRTKPVTTTREKDARQYYSELEELRTEAQAWLAENRPKWRDPSAYWDE